MVLRAAELHLEWDVNNISKQQQPPSNTLSGSSTIQNGNSKAPPFVLYRKRQRLQSLTHFPESKTW